ncbi:unnamed protein product [Peronospora belbahrii]|uniref:Uncharacterized protein n=1 Tax=Peronospora belbahrii TaxID=622444 RepID=A0ABN8CVV8_9STRA|nr:unnamed protein product [Peronospora belbahrii]
MASRLWPKEKFTSFQYTAADMSAHVTKLGRLILAMRESDSFRMTVTRFSFNDLVSKLIAEEVRKKDSSNMEEATALHASKRQEQGKFEKKSSQGKKVMSV